MGQKPEIVTGHDFRGYSASVKYALVSGLLAAGCKVHDIGLAMTPMAYFAQFDLDVPCVAMVTASHNDNGWTGVKMGANRPLTFGPDEMTRLKDIVLSSAFKLPGGGSYHFVENFPARYIADLTKRPKLKRKLKVVCACGNGTAGAFAPQVLEAIGCEVVPLDCELDHTFPKYNPNPEDMEMLHAMRDAVLRTRPTSGSASTATATAAAWSTTHGDEIFADKVGVMLARDMSALHPNSTFVVDVKSTGLYATDPVLQKNGVKADYWKTGHSYMKRRTHELGALAGFEKSGHYFFNKPFGRGYDDGLVSALAICDMLDRNPGKKMSELKDALPKTWGSPTMSPHCDDEKKYGVVDAGGEALRGRADKTATRSPARRSAISSPSTACASRCRTAPGAWCARHPTSPSWWSWSKARRRKRACARCSRRSTACCARIRKSATTIRRSDLSACDTGGPIPPLAGRVAAKRGGGAKPTPNTRPRDVSLHFWACVRGEFSPPGRSLRSATLPSRGGMALPMPSNRFPRYKR